MIARFFRFLSGRKAPAPVIPAPFDLSSVPLERFIEEIETIYNAIEKRYEDLAEDSYVTRTEYSTRLNYIHSFIKVMQEADKADSKVIDLSTDYTDYSDTESEAEEEHCARSCGLEYVPSVVRASGEYEDAISCIEGVIGLMRDAGFEVITEFRIKPFDEEEALARFQEDHNAWLADGLE